MVILSDFSFLFSLPPLQVDTHFCKGVDVICSIMGLIRKNSLPTNKGHSILLCGTLLPHIVEDLNKEEKLYRFSIVKEVEDSRKNKQADFSIFTIKDRVVIEAKLNVGEAVRISLNFSWRQFMQENSQQERTVCVLTDGTMWHLYVVHMRARPLEFNYYVKAVEPQHVCNTINSVLQKGI